MEILFISHKYPPSIGGMEKHCYELIEHTRESELVHKLVHTGEAESKFLFFLKLKRRVKALLMKYPNIDLIYLNDGLMGLFSFWLKSYTEIPVVITFHGLDLVFPNYFFQRIIRKRFVNFDRFICVSNSTAIECLKRGFEKEKVLVIPNGVDKKIKDFAYDRNKTFAFIKKKFGEDLSQKKIISLLGRPVKRKGFSWFLNHVVRYLNEDIKVLMIGPLAPVQNKRLSDYLLPKSIMRRIELLYGGVNDEEYIRELLKEKDIKNKVIQTGKLPLPDLLSLLSLSDLFAMPNIKMKGDAEGFGLVALEASLCKTVVLASNIDGIPDAIQNKKNGYLLPSGEKDIWRQTIEEILKDEEKLIQKGKKFQEFTLNNYGWDNMSHAYIQVFKNVIKHKYEVENY